jgi:hypothetical protein
MDREKVSVVWMLKMAGYFAPATKLATFTLSYAMIDALGLSIFFCLWFVSIYSPFSQSEFTSFISASVGGRL